MKIKDSEEKVVKKVGGKIFEFTLNFKLNIKDGQR